MLLFEYLSLCSVRYKNLKKFLITGNVTAGLIFDIIQSINNPTHTQKRKRKGEKAHYTCSTLSRYTEHLSSVRDIEWWET